MADSFVPSITDKPELEPTLTLTYSTPYGETPADKAVTILTDAELPELTHEGYTFLGWYYDTEFTNPAAIGDTLVSSITTLYALWRKKKTADFNLKTLELAPGRYSVYTVSKLRGFKDSAKSATIEYVVSEEN